MKYNFYPEIQALRAIAVISIFLYHLQLKSFEGGFVGVDIFFVISGFLMTMILYEKKISIINFYISRLKRILPALIFVIVFIFVLTTIIFLPGHLDHFYKSLKYTLLFISNIFFWIKSADYFNINSYFQPLLHTWSLSLEMQFYFIMPFFIFFIKKLSNNSQIGFVLIFILSSLVLSILFIGREQSFYLLPYRICEFFIGTLVYLLKKKNLNIRYNDFFSFISFFILIILILKINNLNFPGIKGISISLFTGLIIFFNYTKIFIRLINVKILQFIGLISYSFFLIHWPVIVIYKYLIVSTFSLIDIAYISLITFVLSIISYYFIENPFKNMELKKFKKILIVYPFIFLILIFLANLIIKDGNKFNYFLNSEKEQIFKKLEVFNDDREKLIKKIKLEDNINSNKKSIIIFGDSHATDIFLGIKQNYNNEKIFYISNNKDCFKILTENKKVHFFEKFQEFLFSKKSVSEFHYKECLTQINKLEKLLKKERHIKSIIISMKWDQEELNYLPYIIKILQKYNINIVLISKRLEIPHLGMALLKENNILNLNKFLDKKINRFDYLNNQLNQIAKRYDVKYFDLNQYICNKDSNSCNFINENQFKYLDYSHFTLKFGKKIMAKSLKEIINK